MFTIKRPTPTTVLYTVSTRSAATTLTAKIQRAAFIAVRILLGLAALSLLYEKATPHLPFFAIDGKSYFHDTPFGHALAPLVTRLTWPILLPSSMALLWLVFRKSYTEESLLVIRGLGVQTSTSSPTYLSTASTRFIPTNMIQDVFIHEAFKGFEVKFFLAIIVEGEEDVVVVFPSTLPKRQMLEEVWRGARACLYEPKA